MYSSGESLGIPLHSIQRHLLIAAPSATAHIHIVQVNLGGLDGPPREDEEADVGWACEPAERLGARLARRTLRVRDQGEEEACGLAARRAARQVEVAEGEEAGVEGHHAEPAGERERDRR